MDVEFGVNALHVSTNRVVRDVECFGDVNRAPSLGEQQEHVNLAAGESLLGSSYFDETGDYKRARRQ